MSGYSGRPPSIGRTVNYGNNERRNHVRTFATMDDRISESDNSNRTTKRQDDTNTAIRAGDYSNFVEMRSLPCENRRHSFYEEWTGEECDHELFFCFSEGVNNNCCKCRPECCGQCNTLASFDDPYQACPELSSNTYERSIEAEEMSSANFIVIAMGIAFAAIFLMVLIVGLGKYLQERKRTSSAKEAHQVTKVNSIWTELWFFLNVAIPTTIMNLSFMVSPVVIASHVGRKFGPIYLSGFTLANMTGNLCAFSLMAGIFCAADTLGPQAFGAGKKKQVGLIAMRGFAFSVCLLLPINVFLVIYMKDILIALGQNEEASKYASDWYRISVWSVPFSIAYNATWKFLSAQQVMKPMMLTSLVSCGIVLPLVLDPFTEHFGFLGSAYAYVVFQGFQPIFVMLYLWWREPYDKDTWPGFQCWREAIFQYEATKDYIHKGIGGILGNSQWIFWEALGLVIGLLGVVPLSVHAIPNQVTTLLCLTPFSAGNALAIRIGITLPKSVNRAKQIAVACVAMTSAVFALVNIGVYIWSDSIIGLFTKDKEVMALTNSLWWKVCMFNESLALYGVLDGVSDGLGLQWTNAANNILWLWAIGLPIIYYMAYIRDGGVDSAWTWINYPYVGMNACLIAAYAMTNWQEIADKIIEEEEENTPIDENKATSENISLIYE